MRYLFLFLGLFIATNSFADVYVATYQDGNIYGLSEERDMVLPPDVTEEIIKDKNIVDLELNYDIKFYKYVNKKFKLQTKVIDDLEKAQAKAVDKQKELKEIEHRMKKQAFDSLKSEGKVFKEISEEDLK